MAEGGISLKKNRQSCSICFEEFKQPKILPCFHTFCAVCLQAYIDRNVKAKTFACPLCRKTLEVPRKGVEEFQTNFYIDFELGSGQDDIPCDGCSKEEPADHRCLECEENFCPQCTEAHTNMKVSRHHELLELTSADVEKRKIKSRVFCTKHAGEEIKVICTRCDVLLCVVCMLTDHQGHKSREVIQEAADVKQKLTSVLDGKEAEEALQVQSKCATELKYLNQKLNDTLDDERRKLKQQGDKVKAVVDDLVKKMSDEMTTGFTDAMNNNKEKILLSERTCQSLRSLLDTATQVLQHENDVGIINKGRNIRNQIKAETKKAADVEKMLLDLDEGASFTDGHIDANLLRPMIGTVTTTKQKPSPAVASAASNITKINNKLRKVASFTSSKANGQLKGIATISQDRAWVSTNSPDRVEMVDINGKSLLTVDLCTKPYCVASDDMDNCIVACPKNRSIKRITVTGSVQDLITDTDGNPYGIAYRKLQTGQAELFFSCKGTSQRRSTIFQAPYCKDAKAAPLSSAIRSAPVSLAVNELCGTICVVDYSYFGAKTIVVLDRTGQLLSKYEPSSIYVWGVCFDHEGCVIVTGHPATDAPHRIKADGSLIEKLPGVAGNRADVDSANRIWFAKDGGYIDVYQL